MVENQSAKSDQVEMPESAKANEDAIRVAEEAAHASLPVTMRVGGQAVHTLKKLYYNVYYSLQVFLLKEFYSVFMIS